MHGFLYLPLRVQISKIHTLKNEAAHPILNNIVSSKGLVQNEKMSKSCSETALIRTRLYLLRNGKALWTLTDPVTVRQDI